MPLRPTNGGKLRRVSRLQIVARDQRARTVVLGAFTARACLLLAAAEIGAQFRLQPFGASLGGRLLHGLFGKIVAHGHGIAENAGLGKPKSTPKR